MRTGQGERSRDERVIRRHSDPLIVPQPLLPCHPGPRNFPGAYLISPSRQPPTTHPPVEVPLPGTQLGAPGPVISISPVCSTWDERWPGNLRGVIDVSGQPWLSVHTLAHWPPALGKEFSFHTSSVTSCRSDFDQVSICLESNKKKKRIPLTHSVGGQPHLVCRTLLPSALEEAGLGSFWAPRTAKEPAGAPSVHPPGQGLVT